MEPRLSSLSKGSSHTSPLPLSVVLRACSALVLLGFVAPVPGLAATVISVGDGDTLRVVEGGKRITIRLACIDAPETAQAPYGAASRAALQRLAPVGSTVELKPQTIDRYGRTVAEVIRSGQNVNLAMVSSSQAFVYWQYIAGCDRGAYGGAEQQAQGRRQGVWSLPGGITRPWDWRRDRPSPGAVAPSGAPPRTTAPSPRPTGALGRRYRCKEIGSYAKAQELLRQGHTYLDGDGDGKACEALR